MKTDNRPLTVYKASAGSGKTFTLTLEYIKLLILHPEDYRTILAVTFTNKATEEMKSRILYQLYGIWKQLPDSHDYMEKIETALSLSPAQISQQAGRALQLLIHNYNYFSIQTIDAFFQTVLRNLAYELDLTANLRIELNDKQIEQAAVDGMIDSLGQTDRVLAWIMRYVRDNIDEDKGWNVIRDIKTFGENIFKDFYKENAAALDRTVDNEKYYDDFKNRMYALCNSAETAMRRRAEEFFSILDGEDISIDEFTYKASGAASYFLKMRAGQFSDAIVGKRVEAGMQSVDAWVSKSAKDKNRADFLRGVVESRIIPLLCQTEEERPTAYRQYLSARLTAAHLHLLRLLGTISRRVHEDNAEKNRFLLSDTHTLLRCLISDSDSPFIFEKIGTRISHIMIDEFQDTSVVQWSNFKVLLNECLSHQSGGNLIVGDVKQSIYRWRNGDWRLLNNIKGEFANADSKLKEEPLKVNYRSERNIISFNNAFFTVVAKASVDEVKEESQARAAQLEKAYSDVKQEVPEGKRTAGYVDITLMPPVADYAERTMQMLTDVIDNLRSHGISTRSMAILVRSNRNLRFVADWLSANRPDIRIFSEEAFQLDSSSSVNVIIRTMRLLLNRNDKVLKANLAKYYVANMSEDKSEEAFIVALEHIDEVVDSLIGVAGDSLSSLPLMDMANRIVRGFALSGDDGQSAYLCAFFDKLNEYVADNDSDIEAFLAEWDAALSSSKIQVDDLDGIRMLTIHKSKGLEFANVLMPFCDWRMEQSQIIWCRPKEEPFNALPLVPVSYSKNSLRGSVYEEDAAEEHFQNVVDNLNMLYVAFTRASQNLFVFGSRGNASLRSCIIEQCLPGVAKALPGSVIDEGANPKTDDMTFRYGSLLADGDEKKKKDCRNVFADTSERHSVSFHTYDNRTCFRQSTESNIFAMSDDEAERAMYIKTGNVLHSMFCNIRTEGDIARVVADYAARGILDTAQLTPGKLETMIRKRMTNAAVARWFEPGWVLYNERTILSANPDTGEMVEHRPDRVMQRDGEIVVVDFKFGSPKPEYIDQVARYMRLLQGMGNARVHGYLWYFYTNKIVEVG